MDGSRDLPALGWSEWARLPELGGFALLAKLDTGARSCSLHVDAQETWWQQGHEWVRFVLRTGVRGPAVQYRLPVADRRVVTSSNGQSRSRVFVRTRLRLDDWEREVELNLTDRRALRHPMLIGRSALAGAWLVDPARRFVLGREPPA